MSRVRYGHCVKCEQPIRPPFLAFKVMKDHGDRIEEWEEVDICGSCSTALSVLELYAMVTS